MENYLSVEMFDNGDVQKYELAMWTLHHNACQIADFVKDFNIIEIAVCKTGRIDYQ